LIHQRHHSTAALSLASDLLATTAAFFAAWLLRFETQLIPWTDPDPIPVRAVRDEVLIDLGDREGRDEIVGPLRLDLFDQRAVEALEDLVRHRHSSTSSRIRPAATAARRNDSGSEKGTSIPSCSCQRSASRRMYCWSDSCAKPAWSRI